MDSILEIERGYVNTYVPLKFNYSDINEYSELIDKLGSCNFVISNQSQDEKGTRIELKPYFYEVCDRIVNTYAFKKNLGSYEKNHNIDSNDEYYLKVTNTFNYDNSLNINNIDSILFDFISHKIEVGYPKMSIYFINDIEQFVSLQLNEIVDSANFSSKFFGRSIAQRKHVLMLWPILIIDKNNEKQLASVDIEFYDLGMAILKISYPIINQSSLPLIENDADLYHESCYYNLDINEGGLSEEFDYEKIPSNSIVEVIDIILSWLQINSDGFIKSENREMILLSQLKPKNIDLERAKKEEREAIYRIINAPITINNNLNPERNKIWEESYWGNNIFRYYFSTMGKCVAIVGQDIKNILPVTKDKLEENRIIDMSLLDIVENAYKVMLFNKLNNQNYLILQNEISYSELRNVEEDYYLAHNYILSLLDESYGTVRDLYNKMVDICQHYLNQASIKQRIQNNEKILKKRQEDRVSKENDRLTILGLIITILVSFPAIYESLYIFRNSFIKNNIKGISVIGVSIITEIIFLFCLFYWYAKRDK